MKQFFMVLSIILFLSMPVCAVEYTAPNAPKDVEDLMPVDTESFGEGLWKIIKNASADLRPALFDAAKVCIGIVAVTMGIAILKQIPGADASVCEFAGTVAIAALLLSSANAMVSLGADTVKQLSEYGKLLLPVMTAAMAAGGAITSSTAIYAGTAAFDAILSAAISGILVPAVYVILILSIAASATGQELLKKLRDLIKNTAGWALRTILYIFTGYISITGVVSGTADAAALKATKLTMAGMVPMVGGILSDASEAVLVGADVVKSAAGVYGLLAVTAIWISPFIQIGVQYLLLKLTAAVCEVFELKAVTELVGSFSSAMGILLAMTGSVCIMLLVSTVCFMRGVA